MLRVAALLVTMAVALPSTSAYAQAGRKPAPSRKPAPAAPPPKVAAKPAPPSDVRFTSRYTSDDQVTESITYVRGNRERYELADMILIRQHDEKRTIQASRAANTYLVTPEEATAAAVQGAPPTGIVNIDTSYVDTGERKTAFGVEARRVKTVITRQPQEGACDKSKRQIDTDGWYIDMPKALAALPQVTSAEPAASACRDEIKASQNGDATRLGFPIGYTTTVTEGDEKPVVMSMEVTAFEVTTLDAALFEIPESMTAAANARALAKAVSDANEANLAAGTPLPGASLPAPAVDAAKAGAIRVGVPEPANKTTNDVDTRALRTRLIAELAEQKVDAAPLAAATPPDLELRARQFKCDYLLIVEVIDLKASNPGRLSRMVKSTAGESNKQITEAKLSVQLVPVGAAKPRLITTTSGKDGGIGVRTGLRIARVAAQLYLRYASPLGALNAMQTMNLGGMGMLNNPLLMQGGGLGASGNGIDRTAGAAMFLVEQAMTASGDAAQDGPSFDASLAEALGDAASKVTDNLKKK